jgi:hypothetical protein
MDASLQGGRRRTVGKRLARKSRRRRAPRRPTVADVVNTVPTTAMARAITGRAPAGVAERLLAERRRAVAEHSLADLPPGARNGFTHGRFDALGSAISAPSGAMEWILRFIVPCPGARLVSEYALWQWLDGVGTNVWYRVYACPDGTQQVTIHDVTTTPATRVRSG